MWRQPHFAASLPWPHSQISYFTYPNHLFAMFTFSFPLFTPDVNIQQFPDFLILSYRHLRCNIYEMELLIFPHHKHSHRKQTNKQTMDTYISICLSQKCILSKVPALSISFARYWCKDNVLPSSGHQE